MKEPLMLKRNRWRYLKKKVKLEFFQLLNSLSPLKRNKQNLYKKEREIERRDYLINNKS